MSPRKSSTSSGRSRPRPRYLGIEAAGEHLPPLSPRGWESALTGAAAALRPAGPLPFRLVRFAGRRAIVEVEHAAVADARRAWNGPRDGIVLATRRTWGTLVGAKRWLRAPPPERADAGP
ncbi:MAG TPA: hypothetical protein VMG99_07435 [Thermoplasmata archaeon]|nr:hypothetical protein [Thermoplasmata archaeon]